MEEKTEYTRQTRCTHNGLSFVRAGKSSKYAKRVYTLQEKNESAAGANRSASVFICGSNCLIFSCSLIEGLSGCEGRV